MTKHACLLLALAWVSGAQNVNFSGVWELNKNAPGSAGQTPDNMRVKIDHQGASFEVTMRATVRGNQEQQMNKIVIGQETKGQMFGNPMTSRTEWEGNTLVVHSVADIMNKQLRLTDRYSLSADGNTLTFRERHQYGTEPEAEDIHFFDRRPATSWEPDAQPKPAEEVFKNIQTLKGMPSMRFRMVMMNLTRWLGVECAYCHVMGQFEKDDKPAKQTARKMFQMVATISRDLPADAVTCWTCHRGHAKPEGLPPQ